MEESGIQDGIRFERNWFGFDGPSCAQMEKLGIQDGIRLERIGSDLMVPLVF